MCIEQSQYKAANGEKAAAILVRWEKGMEVIFCCCPVFLFCFCLFWHYDMMAERSHFCLFQLQSFCINVLSMVYVHWGRIVASSQ